MLMLMLTFSLYTFEGTILQSFVSLWGQSSGQFKTKNTFLYKLVSTNWLHKLGFQRKDKIDPFKVDQGITT